MKPGKTGIARIIDATTYSLQGLRACWLNEAAFRQGVAASIVLVSLSFWLAQSIEQWLLLVIPVFLWLIAELFNSAIEAVVDRIGADFHELSGRAKDMASATVMISIFITFVCWSAIAWKNFGQFFWTAS